MNIVLSDGFVVTGWFAFVCFALLVHLQIICYNINVNELYLDGADANCVV